MRHSKQITYFTPLGLLALTACGGGSSTISSLLTSNGNVVKGPLDNALVYAVYDDARLGNSDSVRTDENGKYTLSTVNNNYTIVAITDESTIDKSSGSVMSGVTLKAPSGATVVTPASTLMEEGGITAAQVVEVLGLPEGIDPLTFNAFDDDVNADDALAVEQASHQIMSVINAFAAAAEGSGVSESDAFEAAVNSIVKVVKTKVANLDDDTASASDKTLDLSNTADLALIKAQAITEVASIEGVTSGTTTAFDALADATATAVENVNTEIAKASDLTSDASKSIFSTTQVLADQVKAAAVAEVEASGTGSIDFIDSASVVTSAANAIPSSINLSLSSISEGAESLVIGVLSTVDSDQPDDVAFKYEIAEIDGTDYEFFSINQSTGELSLIAQPDYETKSTYSVTILSTDSGGKTLSETFTVAITDANEAPTLTVPTGGSVTEDAVASTITGSLIGSDPEDNSLTYSIADVTASSGSYSLAGTYGTLVLNATTGAYTYTLDNSATATNALAVGGSETETFSIKVSDGTNTTVAQNLSFAINGANDAPSSIALDSTSVVENTAGAIVGALSGNDPEGTPLSYSVAQSDDGPSFEIDGSNNLKLKSASADYETKSSYKLTVIASDQDLQTPTEFTVSVSDVNEAPSWQANVATLVVDEDADLSYDLTGIASDDDQDVLIYDLIEAPSWVTLSEGVLAGTPINADVGVEDIRVKVSDGALEAIKGLRIDVTNTNDTPTITSTEVTGVNEDAAYSYTFEASDVDVGDTLTLAAPKKPSWLSFDTDTGVLSGTPTNSDVGDHSIVLTATDGSSVVDTQSFTLTVSNTNDTPTITSTEVTGVNEDAAYSYTFEASDVDVGDTLTLAAPTKPSWLSFDTDTGVLSGTPTNSDVGDHSIVLTATDGSNVVDTQSFTLTVTNTNDVSVVTADEPPTGGQWNLTEQGPNSIVTVTGSLSITDVDTADNPSFANVTDAATVSGYGTVSLANGEWVYTLNNLAVNNRLNEGDTDTDSYTFVATDGSSHQINIKITGIDSDSEAPTLLSFSVVPEFAGTLGIGNTVIYTATASEAMRADTSMSITLSNNVSVTLAVVEDAPTTLVGTYEIKETETINDLTIAQYSALTAVDLSGNALSTTPAIGGITGSGGHSIVIDATAPEAKIDATGHTYDAATGVLTLKASELATMGAADGADVKSQVDMTKLSWDINQSGSSLETFTNDDVTSIILSDTNNTLTITLTDAKSTYLAGTTNFGGQGASNLDGLDIDPGFLNDNAGNASDQPAVNNAAVTMEIIAPTLLKFNVVPESNDILVADNTVIYTATASEAMRADTSMSITLSNDVTVTLTVVENAPTTLSGTYTIGASDNGDTDLTIAQYSALTAVDISGNALSTTPAIGEITGSGGHSIVVDTTAPEAKIDATGHTYDAATGVLTLKASELATMGAADGADVKSQVDMTKLSWDINQSGSSLETFTNDDVTSIILSDTNNTLTITLTDAKSTYLAGTTNFGGQGASNLDGLDIDPGFLNDNAGNASDQPAVDNAAVTMEIIAPTLLSFNVVPESNDILGIGNTIIYTATASEAMRADTSMSITLSNDVTVTLTVVENAPTTLSGTYTIGASDNGDTDLTIAQYTALTAVDISGNALSTTPVIGGIAGSGGHSIVVDTQAPTLVSSAIGAGNNSFKLVFNEEISNQEDISAVLKNLSITDENPTITWASSGVNVNVETQNELSVGELSIELTIEDLAGNQRTYDEITLEIL
jgi:VCBS repeat-containing protein